MLIDWSSIWPPTDGKAVVYVLSTKYNFCPDGIAAYIAEKSVLLPDEIVIEVALAPTDSPVVRAVGDVAAWKRHPAAFWIP